MDIGGRGFEYERSSRIRFWFFSYRGLEPSKYAFLVSDERPNMHVGELVRPREKEMADSFLSPDLLDWNETCASSNKNDTCS